MANFLEENPVSTPTEPGHVTYTKKQNNNKYTHTHTTHTHTHTNIRIPPTNNTALDDEDENIHRHSILNTVTTLRIFV
jgi:hypothetical protein